jgi:hypothetical protein
MTKRKTITTEDVRAIIDRERIVSTQTTSGFCAVCHKSTVRAVVIHDSPEEVIPLCSAHFGEIGESLRAKRKKR